MKTLIEILANGNAQATCLSAAQSAPLSYSALRELVQYVQTAFNQVGIGRNDRVALVLTNSAEMAASFVTVACCCTSAPLNPSYRADEFEFYLNDLNAKALVVEKGSSSPAVAVAAKMGIALIELEPTPALGAGSFTLNMNGLSPKAAQHPGPAQPDDVALVLHTSGTTSRPKIVPLTHRNVSASAQNIAHSTRFSSSDRGLNVMPLFHIHGLIAGILAPLSQGGEVFCTSGFNALKFFSQMDGQAHLVHRSAHHAPGYFVQICQQQRSHCKGATSIHSFVIFLIATSGFGRARSHLQGPCDRSLWHDRSGPPNGLQSAAAWPKKTGHRRLGSRP